ncbi:MAG: family 1 encapsulin nanocompartment shell protein [Methermicoccaceae archaeon]
MGALTPEQYRQVKQEVVIAARRANVARKLMAVRGPLGLGVQQYSYDTLTELSEAIISHIFETRDVDAPNLTRTNVNIPVLQKTFELQRRDVESSRRFGTPLNTAAASSAAYRVAYAENELAILGWAKDGSTYDINGLYNAAGNDYSTTKDFGTAGNAIDAVAGAMGLLLDDNIAPPYNLVLNPTQYAELTASVLSNGDREITHVKEIIGGDIFVTPYITDGTGMLLAQPEARFFELVVAQDLTVETEELPKTKNVFGRVFECVVPVVYDVNAICKLSDI